MRSGEAQREAADKLEVRGKRLMAQAEDLREKGEALLTRAARIRAAVIAREDGERPPPEAFDPARAATLLTEPTKQLLQLIATTQRSEGVFDLGVAAQLLYGADSPVTRQRISSRLSVLRQRELVRYSKIDGKADGCGWELDMERVRAARRAQQEQEAAASAAS